MVCRRATFILLLAFFGFSSSPAYAQINLKTGYNFSILSTPDLDRMINAFNQSQSYTSAFHQLHWLHGFEGGLRLKGGIHAVELTYQAASKSFRAKGDLPGSTNEYTDKLGYVVHSTALGYQISSGSLGLGTDLQYQWYKVKYVDGQAKATFKNVQQMTAFKFYLMWTFSGDNGIDFVFQPYIILPAKYYDLKPLSEILKVEPGEGKDKWIRYGLTIVFYNGEK